MAAVLHLLLLLLIHHSTLASGDPPPDSVPMTDSMALLLLKDSFTNASALSSWTPGSTNPCDTKSPWPGILCFNGIVTGLRLGGMGLAGTIDVDALFHFKALRTVSFVDNALSGPIPNLSRLDALKSVYISNNRFSGEIPDGFFSEMTHLKKLWLDGNNFTGRIPSSLSEASSLIELRLEGNRFTGSIPELTLPSLRSFNVSGNDLDGAIPASFARFNATSFQGNPRLCGPQLGRTTCATAPPTAPPLSHVQDAQSGKITIVAVVLLLLLAALSAGVAVVRRRREAEFDTLGVDHGEDVAEAMEAAAPDMQQKQYGSSHKRSGSSRAAGGSSKAGGGGFAELVMVNEEKGVFGLPDLMKAAAEVLGNGGLGSAYKAVMASGVAVVVKRMREMNRVGKDVFDAEMRKLGRLRHRNVLTPLAYHYRKEEKLVVCEFIQKGNLLYLLHGDRGPDHAALDWPTRLKIARGIAGGMSYLHAELAALDVPHGNLKSGNVLIGPDFEPLVADYGFIALVNPSQASQALFAYKSPEALQYRHVSSKSDVYSLGIIILELLTGKFPSQYLNNTKGGTDVVQWAASAIAERREAELLDPNIAGGGPSVPLMVRLLRVGSACTEPNPDQRPDMREAAAMIEEIAAAYGGDGPREEDPLAAPAPSLIDGYADLSLSSNGRDGSVIRSDTSQRNG